MNRRLTAESIISEAMLKGAKLSGGEFPISWAILQGVYAPLRI